MYNGVYPDYLYHHGILGMKWGKRNGPPYPLAPSDHSASERKAGWRQSLGEGINNLRRKRLEKAANATARDAANLRANGYIKEADAVQRVSDNARAKAAAVGSEADRARIKKGIKTGLAIAGTALAVYGAVKVNKAYRDKKTELGQQYMSKHGSEMTRLLNDIGRSSGMNSDEAAEYAGRATRDYLAPEAERYASRNAAGALARDTAGRVRNAAGRAAATVEVAARNAYSDAKTAGLKARDTLRNPGETLRNVGDRVRNSELARAAGRTAERAGVAVRGAASRAIDRQNERAEARRQAGVELSSRAADYASRAGRDYQPGRDERRLATLERAERVGSAVARVTSPLRNAARAVGSAASNARNSELAKAAGRTAERAGVAVRGAASRAIDRQNERASQREVDRQAAAIERERKRQEREARRRR